MRCGLGMGWGEVWSWDRVGWVRRHASAPPASCYQKLEQGQLGDLDQD